MKLFTVGPVEMYDEILEVSGKQLPYFRTPEFSEIMLNVVDKLKKCAKTSDDSQVVVITGSGSASMEAVVSNAFDETDKLLVINGGSFGRRFEQICEIYNIRHDSIKLNRDEELTKEHFSNYENNGYTGLLVNVHETSTGQLYNINIINDFCKRNNMYLVVDAISSFLADDFDMDGNGIDCTIISSQKALSLSPGLSMIIMNKKFYENKVKDKPAKNLYLNINEHIKNIERGQTPNTPAVGIVLELNAMLNKIDAMGIDNYKNMIVERANYFRSKIKEIDRIKLPDFPISNALTPLVFENGGAKDVYNYLKEKYNLIVTPNGGDLAEYILRVGHLGDLKLSDYDELIERMKEVIK